MGDHITRLRDVRNTYSDMAGTVQGEERDGYLADVAALEAAISSMSQPDVDTADLLSRVQCLEKWSWGGPTPSRTATPPPQEDASE